MKNLFFTLAAIFSFASFTAFAAPGEGACRGGYLANTVANNALYANWAQGACADIKSEGEGICRGGYFSNPKSNMDINWVRSACSDVKSVEDGKCRAGYLSNPKQNIQDENGARSQCQDL